MTLDELLDLQRSNDLVDVHLVDVDEDGFRLAHTDHERSLGLPLEDCPLHAWLRDRDEAPAASGLYVAVRHVPDGYSESLRAEPWDLEPLDVA